MTRRPPPEVVDSPPEPVDVRTEPAHVHREAFDKVRMAPVERRPYAPPAERRPYAPTRSSLTSSGLPVGVADRGLLVQSACGLLALFNQAGVSIRLMCTPRMLWVV